MKKHTPNNKQANTMKMFARLLFVTFRNIGDWKRKFQRNHSSGVQTHYTHPRRRDMKNCTPATSANTQCPLLGALKSLCWFLCVCFFFICHCFAVERVCACAFSFIICCGLCHFATYSQYCTETDTRALHHFIG